MASTVTRFKRRPKGTWMRLRSAELLRAFVGPEPDKRMSGRKLARAAGKHPSFINHLTAGRETSCTPQTADRIADALGVPTDVLFEERLTSAERPNGKLGKSTAA
ncbi:helix-turn-helix transcriptional regulator [Mycolicibacterium setense]|uniref:helix-turn-helix domain-containing protein n=1 Tax=Mycolicibacterium setense TaxID=431269 RepID=UPI002E13E9A9